MNLIFVADRHLYLYPNDYLYYIQMKMPMMGLEEGRKTRIDGRYDPKV